MKRLIDRLCWTFMLLSGLLLAVALLAPKALAQDDGWPRTLPVGEGLVTIYPLQLDAMNGDVVRYRAALAWRETADAEPVFGAGWFESRVDLDRAAGLVRPLDLQVTNTRFPAGTADVQADLAQALNRYAPGWDLTYSTERLDAALQTAQAERESMAQLKTAPPRIVYRDRPALLVTFDGEPILRAIEDSDYQAVINTPYPLIHDGRAYYLNVAKGAWYRADEATGPYRFEPSPPPAIAALVKPEQAVDSAAGAAPESPSPEPITAANAPEIVVATQPTELVVTDGPAAFVPLVGDLLVLQNSDDDVFMDVASQKFYIVLSGRWYRADTLNGPWEYQASDQLPAAFAEIPEDSAQSDARVYVAGTPEAEDAVLDAQVPQTAAVARGPADVDVTYDGEPEFAAVDGTDLEYAVNSDATVIGSDRRYFMVEDGVWYVSSSPNGPWRVSDYRPADVDLIRPTSPVYHVKYVYIYDSTPDVVYVGYTPGYLGSYVYYDTVVYGTGWYYRPWVSPRYYYPRFSTWGFHVGYNPWSGWSFGLSWNWGWGSDWYASFGWGWGPYYVDYYRGGYWHHHRPWYHRNYGYWGPRGYCPRPPHHGRHHDRYAYDRGHYDGGRYGRGYPGRHPNLYRDAGQRARVADTWDKLPRERDWKDATAARVKNANPGYRKQGWQEPQRTKLAAQDARGRYGDQPVKASDLRAKAGARDVNAKARQQLMVADRGGKVYRQPEAAGQQRARVKAAPPPARSAKPVPVQLKPDTRSAQPQARAGKPAARQDKPVIRDARPSPSSLQRRSPADVGKPQDLSAKRRAEPAYPAERRQVQAREAEARKIAQAPSRERPASSAPPREMRKAPPAPARSAPAPSKQPMQKAPARSVYQAPPPVRQAPSRPMQQAPAPSSRQASPGPPAKAPSRSMEKRAVQDGQKAERGSRRRDR